MKLLDDAKFHVRSNGYMVVVWTGLLPITLLFWRDSMVWLVFMSWYANWVGHISSWLAAKAERNAESGV